MYGCAEAYLGGVGAGAQVTCCNCTVLSTSSRVHCSLCVHLVQSDPSAAFKRNTISADEEIGYCAVVRQLSVNEVNVCL